MTDELDSDAKDDSSDDMQNVVRLNEEYGITNDFKFKVGIKFSSFKQFKSVILEHNILNGRDVRFEKNDALRYNANYAHTISFFQGRPKGSVNSSKPNKKENGKKKQLAGPSQNNVGPSQRNVYPSKKTTDTSQNNPGPSQASVQAQATPTTQTACPNLLLNGVINEKDVVLDIQPLNIDISPSKSKPVVNHNPSKSSSARIFIGKTPKVTNSKTFKPPGIVKATLSDLASLIMSNL
ncbi:hypothetical protein KIW84_035289 [Lathyrus oleraceus]|uniref:Uncharacterized protein n=1 Tax=Pisum sativum TaxID=3888 RepID=A0A9D4Y5Q9_PEA|nr:hypothetical protein KIW84_035289 [Pisum sativum]